MKFTVQVFTAHQAVTEKIETFDLERGTLYAARRAVIKILKKKYQVVSIHFSESPDRQSRELIAYVWKEITEAKDRVDRVPGKPVIHTGPIGRGRRIRR